MKYMLILNANEQSEAGGSPSEDDLNAMGAYNDELIKAGVLLAGEGLHPSSDGARVEYDGDERVGDRRPVHRDEGAHGRVLDHPGRQPRRRRSSGRGASR